MCRPCVCTAPTNCFIKAQILSLNSNWNWIHVKFAVMKIWLCLLRCLGPRISPSAYGKTENAANKERRTMQSNGRRHSVAIGGASVRLFFGENAVELRFLFDFHQTDDEQSANRLKFMLHETQSMIRLSRTCARQSACISTVCSQRKTEKQITNIKQTKRNVYFSIGKNTFDDVECK